MLGYLLLAPAFLPLLRMQAFMFPYVSPKTFAFRGLGILVLAALAYLVLAGRELHFGRLKRKSSWIPAVLLAVAYGASLAGPDFFHSFWSNLERGDGLLTFTVAVLFFYATLLHADGQFVRRLAVTSMWIGGLVALNALCQWLSGWTGIWLPFVGEPTRFRPGATFGNPVLAASYLGMTFCLTLWLAREYRGRWRVLAGAVAGLQLVAIFLCATRGTILALGVVGVAAAVHVSWKGTARPRLLARAALAGCAVLLALFFIFRAQLAQAPVAFVQRLASTSISESAASDRFLTWQMVGREALNHPLAGVGAEHFDKVFNKVYDPDRITGEWMDRSHNAYLDYLVQYGFPGALMYLALVLAALQAAYTLLKSGNVLGGYLLAFFATYAVQNFFSFDTGLALWLFLAALASASAITESAPRVPAVPRMHVVVRSVLVLFILLLIVPVAILPARASHRLQRAFTIHPADVRQEAADLASGFALNTYADLEYGHYAGRKYVEQQASKLEGEPRVLAHRATLDILTRNFRRYPEDTITAVFLATVIYLAPEEVQPDRQLLAEAIDRVSRLSPRRWQAWYFRAYVELNEADAAVTDSERQAHQARALEIFTEYARLQPRSADVRYLIAGLCLAMGDPVQAEQSARAGEALYNPTVETLAAGTAHNAARYYMDTGQWLKAGRFLQDIVASTPEDYPVLFDLARVRFHSGDTAGARAILQRLRAASPAILDTDREFVMAIEGR